MSKRDIIASNGLISLDWGAVTTAMLESPRLRSNSASRNRDREGTYRLGGGEPRGLFEPLRLQVRQRGDAVFLLGADDLVGQRRVDGMPGLFGEEVPDDGIPDQRDVPQQVEQLVADELVREAQAGVDDPGLVQHDRVLERPS